MFYLHADRCAYLHADLHADLHAVEILDARLDARLDSSLDSSGNNHEPAHGDTGRLLARSKAAVFQGAKTADKGSEPPSECSKLLILPKPLY